MPTNVQVPVRTVASVNPASGEVLRELACAGEEEVHAAVVRSRAVQAQWCEVGPRKRVEILREFQRLLCEKKSDVARLITREAGKPYVEALLTEVMVVLDAARFLIDNAYGLLRDEPVDHGNLAMKTKVGRIVREPYGVIGIISPWNYPFSIPATEAVAALVAGNAVVLKPSEFTSLVAFELASLLHAAGVPKDVFQVIPGDGATGAALIGSDIDKLIFTGSVATGKWIAQAAAARLLPVVLELGGKDPMIVLDDADAEVASSGAVWGAFVNAGQACLSVERCYVHRSLYDAFVAACARKAKQLRVGDGLNPEIEVGPLIHERQLRNVEAHVEEAVSRGARVLTGGTRLPDLGVDFYAPTVLADVNHETRIMREETFGPVLPIMRVRDVGEAIAYANDSPYGLNANVWTRNRRRGVQLAKEIQSGCAVVNDCMITYGITESPFGGVKQSGIGRVNGEQGLLGMCHTKSIVIDRVGSRSELLWFPHSARKASWVKRALRVIWGTSLGRWLA